MDEEIIERLEELASDVVKDVDEFVPVIGNLLYTYKDGTDLYTNFLSFIDKKVNAQASNKKTSIVIPESVIKFLAKGKFKLILTTSPFDVLDKKLSSNGVVVKSYYHRWKQNESTNKVELAEGETLIYHLLGGYHKNSLPETESEFLECLVSYQIGKANSLPDILNGKQILLLGSGIPTWLFLLLWYPLMRTSGIRYLFKQESIENTEFQNYLNSVNFKTEEAMNKFLDLVIKKFPDSIPSPRNFDYDVFLSYKSQDEPFAEKIYKHLTEKHGLKVWFMGARKDTISPGDYSIRIAEGVARSRTFMPLIGEAYYSYLLEYWVNPDRGSLDPLRGDLGIISEIYLALKESEAITRTNGLNKECYVIPVWNMDESDNVKKGTVKNVLCALGIIKETTMKYGCSEEGKEISGDLTDFQTVDWKEKFANKNV